MKLGNPSPLCVMSHTVMNARPSPYALCRCLSAFEKGFSKKHLVSWLQGSTGSSRCCLSALCMQCFIVVIDTDLARQVKCMCELQHTILKVLTLQGVISFKHYCQPFKRSHSPAIKPSKYNSILPSGLLSVSSPVWPNFTNNTNLFYLALKRHVGLCNFNHTA